MSHIWLSKHWTRLKTGIRFLDDFWISLITSSSWDASLGLAIYYLHLGLNLSWSPIFFKAKKVRKYTDSGAFTSLTVPRLALRSPVVPL